MSWTTFTDRFADVLTDFLHHKGEHRLVKKSLVGWLALACVIVGIKLMKLQSSGVGLGIFASFFALNGCANFPLAFRRQGRAFRYFR
jgi:hypothetical protein